MPSAGIEARLLPIEKLMIINHMPQEIIDIYMMIDSSEERFTEVEMAEMVHHIQSLRDNSS